MKISRFFILSLLLSALFLYNGGYKTVLNAAGSMMQSFTDQRKPLAEIDDAQLADDNDFYNSTLYPLLALDSIIAKQEAKEHYTPLSQIAPQLRQAIIATEDARFYEHFGIDLTGIGRAALVNLQYGKIEEGASTITQQLAKNLFLSSERTFTRKARELLLTFRLETACDKDKLLELYLNTIYFGSGYYGIYEAADGYFGKTPAELSLAESAMLAGLPNAPSLYSPYEDFSAAKTRQAIVMSRLSQLGYISDEEAAAALAEPIWLAN